MRTRKVSVLIDGGFFYKRIRRWHDVDRTDPKAVADAARYLCKRHVQKLTGEPQNTDQSRWLDHVYRLFYYDAKPYDGEPFHPFEKKQVKFASSTEARFREALFGELRRKRKFALRLGSVIKEGDNWIPYDRHMKRLLDIWHHADYLSEILEDPSKLEDAKTEAAQLAISRWKDLPTDGVSFPLRQKGVDMRIGLDITTMTLKGQVDTIVLVTGDSDFVPAAKVARREGVEFILDPMYQSVGPDLLEHVDGVASGLDRPVDDGNAAK